MLLPKRKTSDDMRAMPDVQSQSDARGVRINWAGIKSLQRPICFDDHGCRHHTVACVDLFVDLEAARRGIHMSRLMEMLENNGGTFSLSSLQSLLLQMSGVQQSGSACVALHFPLFLQKQSPVTKIPALVDYDIRLSAEVCGTDEGDGQRLCRLQVQLVVPVTSLCPCSRDISRYGAHNQRSHITLLATIASVHANEICIADLIRALEAQGSSELYGVLKRSDEQFVTEHAYDNPKFVEDIARDVAVLMKSFPAIHAWRIEVENFESIHNYSAYACIDSAGVKAADD